ncbi:MAG: hypothetical protein ACHBN1_32705 [Heteroscytonema crispum UTEX LB 1556]
MTCPKQRSIQMQGLMFHGWWFASADKEGFPRHESTLTGPLLGRSGGPGA